MKIIYGTGNVEKIKQMEKIIKINNFDVELLSIKDINFNEDIIEDGKTFEENSKIKADAIRKFCNSNGYGDYIIITDVFLQLHYQIIHILYLGEKQKVK